MVLEPQKNSHSLRQAACGMVIMGKCPFLHLYLFLSRAPFMYPYMENPMGWVDKGCVTPVLSKTITAREDNQGIRVKAVGQAVGLEARMARCSS